MTESINVRAKVDAPIFRLLKQDWEPTREQVSSDFESHALWLLLTFDMALLFVYRVRLSVSRLETL
jgi:hypothetical protein